MLYYDSKALTIHNNEYCYVVVYSQTWSDDGVTMKQHLPQSTDEALLQKVCIL